MHSNIIIVIILLVRANNENNAQQSFNWEAQHRQIVNVYEWKGERLIVPAFIRQKFGQINLSTNENILTIVRIKTLIICFIQYPNIVFQMQFAQRHAFNLCFSIWINPI